MDKRLKEIVDNFDSMKIGVDEPFRFHCTMCGKCCINREDILLTPRDMYCMAKELQITPKELFDQYCETYIEHGKKFFEGVNERYTEYAKLLEPKIGIPYTIITPLIFTFVRACVHYAMFEDEYYLKTQMEVLKQGVALFADKYRSQYLNGGNEK